MSKAIRISRLLTVSIIEQVVCANICPTVSQQPFGFGMIPYFMEGENEEQRSVLCRTVCNDFSDEKLQNNLTKAVVWGFPVKWNVCSTGGKGFPSLNKFLYESGETEVGQR